MIEYSAPSCRRAGGTRGAASSAPQTRSNSRPCAEGNLIHLLITYWLSQRVMPICEHLVNSDSKKFYVTLRRHKKLLN